MHVYLKSLFLFCLAGCITRHEVKSLTKEPHFSQPVRVAMRGYTGNIMEPFLSRNGKTLLFNNLNGAPENTNLHWAIRINDTVFQYKGEITGVNTPALEAVASLDEAGNLYFVSTRSYEKTLSTLYQCRYKDGVGTDVHLVEGVSKLKAGNVNFDAEISADGTVLYFVDAKFSNRGVPETADLVIAQKSGSGFVRLANSDYLMENINTDALEYGACISPDQLVLYFTRVTVPFTPTSSPEIFVATRPGIKVPFNIPVKVKNITGFAEAPTVSPDQQFLYYHKKEHDKFVLYMIRIL